MPTVSEAIEFLRDQRLRQSSLFAASEGQYVLSFLGTTSSRGLSPTLSVHRLDSLEPLNQGTSFRIVLTGELPREPQQGESVTLSITDWPRFRGYQLKTDAAAGASLIEKLGPGRFALRASQVFTVHHSPNTVQMFEQIPVAEVLEAARVAPAVVLGIGPQVNISPRFIMAFEERDGKLALFHGDGEANKTWINLQQNTATARVVSDYQEQRGLIFEGPCRQVTQAEAPEAVGELLKHFGRVGYGPPARVYRQQVSRIAAF
jgi:hypothetical protein